MPGSFANGGAEAIRRLWKQGVVDRRAVAAGVDGVHDREGAAYAKGKAEKEADDGGPGEAHAAVKFTRTPVSILSGGTGRDGQRLAGGAGAAAAAAGVAKILRAFCTV